MKANRNNWGVGLTLLATLFCNRPSAVADLLYDNGPINGTAGFANALNGGWQETDSFTVLGPATLTGAQVALWVDMGESPVSLGWSIGTTPFGTEVSSGGSQLTNTFVMNFINFPTSYSIYESQFGLSGTVAAGTYWLTLHSGVATRRNLDLDVNFGPSTSFQRNGNSTFAVNGHSFQIFGDATPAPEPATVVMMLGFGVIVGPIVACRRRRRQHVEAQ